MKLLLIATPTSRFMSKCSSYYACRTIGQAFLQGGPNRFVYCAVPAEGTVSNHVADALVTDDRWVNVPIRYSTGDRYQNMLAPPEDMLQFCNWSSYWDWDALCTTSNNGWYWRIFSQARPAVDLKFPRHLTLIDAFPMFSFKRTLRWNPKRDVSFLTSYLAFDHVTIQANHERRGILEAAREWLSATSYNALIERIAITYPMPTVDLSQAEQHPISQGRLKLLYCQRLDRFERRSDEMLDVLRGAFTTSSNVDVLITTNSLAKSVGPDTAFIAFQQATRAEFYAALRTVDVSLTWSREEGIPYSLLEAAAHGVIPIAKREPWSEEFYGAGYWGLVTSEAEAVAKVKWVAAHREESRLHFRRWYRDTFRPHIEQAGTLTGLHEQWLTAHHRRLTRSLKMSTNSLASVIQRAPIASVDLNDADALSQIEGVRMNAGSAFKPMAPPLSRRRDVYVDRLRLLQNGWADTAQPGVLQRSGDELTHAGVSCVVGDETPLRAERAVGDVLRQPPDHDL